MTTILCSTTHTSKFMDTNVEVCVIIDEDYKTTAKFSLYGRPYKFDIVSWSRRDLTPFLLLFFSFVHRDEEKFGLCAQGYINMTSEHKVNAVIQGVKDVIHCIDIIASKHKQSLIDYAVWYNENYPKWTTYDTYITTVACNIIANTYFLAPGASWEIVRFVRN